MNDLKLFLVQDSDRPLYVLARSWQSALEKWQEAIRKENELSDLETPDPSGIQLVADADEVLR